MTRPISSFHFVGMFFLLLGHYVVVCGYDLKKKKIFYKNPSYDEGKHYTYVKTIKVFLSLTPPPPNFKTQWTVIQKMLFIHHTLCVN